MKFKNKEELLDFISFQEPGRPEACGNARQHVAFYPGTLREMINSPDLPFDWFEWFGQNLLYEADPVLHAYWYLLYCAIDWAFDKAIANGESDECLEWKLCNKAHRELAVEVFSQLIDD